MFGSTRSSREGKPSAAGSLHVSSSHVSYLEFSSR